MGVMGSGWLKFWTLDSMLMKPLIIRGKTLGRTLTMLFVCLLRALFRPPGFAWFRVLGRFCFQGPLLA